MNANHDFKNKLLEYCFQEADSLIQKAKCGQDGIYWRINDSGRLYNDYYNRPDPSIYHGVGGILLFILEVFRINKEIKYFNLLTECSSWLFNQCILRPAPGFYNGCSGILYIFLEIFQSTGDSRFLEWSNKILQAKRNTTEPLHTNGLFNGLAGESLGLLKLFSLNSDPRILTLIENNIEILFDRAKITDNGIYWYDPMIGINNLSFISGNLGIAHTLQQIGLLLKDPEITWCIHQVKNFIRTSTQQNNFRNSNWNFSQTLIHKDIPISNAFQDKPINLKIDPFNKRNSINYSIASGLAGSGLFQLELYNIKLEKRFLDNANTIAGHILNTIHRENTLNHPIGLFKGTVGIAYFFLKLLQKESSIINPTILSGDKQILKANRKISLQRWRYKTFPTTMIFAKKMLPPVKFEEMSKSISEFDPFSSRWLKKLFNYQSNLEEIYSIDCFAKLLQKQETIFNINFLMSKKLSSLSIFRRKKFTHCISKINPNVKLVELSLYLKEYFKAEQLFICLTSNGVKIYPLRKTDILILKIIGTKISSIHKNSMDFMEHSYYSNLGEKEEIKSFFIKQLHEFATKEMIYLELPKWQSFINRLKRSVPL